MTPITFDPDGSLKITDGSLILSSKYPLLPFIYAKWQPNTLLGEVKRYPRPGQTLFNRFLWYKSQPLCTRISGQTPYQFGTFQLPLASLALAGGYARFSAMTHPFVLSLSMRMTFSIRPQEDKEIPPARAAQALLTLPPPSPGVLIPTNP